GALAQAGGCTGTTRADPLHSRECRRSRGVEDAGNSSDHVGHTGQLYQGLLRRDAGRSAKRGGGRLLQELVCGTARVAMRRATISSTAASALASISARVWS